MITTATLKVVDAGENATISLPQEMLDKFGIRPGDNLQLVATENGIALTSHDAANQSQLELAERVLEERRDVLRRLAE